MAVKAPSIGQLRQSGSLQVNNPTQLGAGKKDNFSELLTCRGDLQKMKGNRILDSGETVIAAGWQWIVRYQTAIESITDKKSIRWVIDGRSFVVSDYQLIDNKKKYYRFILLENE